MGSEESESVERNSQNANDAMLIDSNGDSRRNHLTPTTTNSLVVERFLKSDKKVSADVLQLFLDVLHDPAFDKSLLTLRSASDMYTYEASARTFSASRRTRHSATLRVFPPLVIENIISDIEALRGVKRVHNWEYMAEMHSNPVMRQRVDPAWSTLATMSLVHPSWTWPAQKAIGRELIAVRDNGDVLRKAVTSPLFGPWTKSACITYSQTDRGFSTRLIRPERRTIIERDVESAFLFCELMKKTPKIRNLSLELDLCREASARYLRSVFTAISSLKDLETLVLMRTSSYVSPSFAPLLMHIVGELPKLSCLWVQTWDISARTIHLQNAEGEQDGTAQVQDVEDVVELTTKPRPATIKNVQLIVSPQTPIDFAVWLLQADDNGASNIRDLTLSTSDVDNSTIMPRLSAIIDAIRPAAAFSSLRTLTLSINSATAPEETVTTILRSCSVLQEFKISHRRMDNISFVLDNLPSTVKTLTYNTRLFDSGVGSANSFDRAFSVWLRSDTFRSLHPSLRALGLVLTHVVPLPGHPLTQQQQQELHNKPKPALWMIEAACREADVSVCIHWSRAFAFAEDAGMDILFGEGGVGQLGPIGQGAQGAQANDQAEPAGVAAQNHPANPVQPNNDPPPVPNVEAQAQPPQPPPPPPPNQQLVVNVNGLLQNLAQAFQAFAHMAGQMHEIPMLDGDAVANAGEEGNDVANVHDQANANVNVNANGDIDVGGDENGEHGGMLDAHANGGGDLGDEVIGGHEGGMHDTLDHMNTE